MKNFWLDRIEEKRNLDEFKKTILENVKFTFSALVMVESKTNILSDVTFLNTKVFGDDINLGQSYFMCKSENPPYYSFNTEEFQNDLERIEAEGWKF
jgi:hypothetical protein